MEASSKNKKTPSKEQLRLLIGQRLYELRKLLTMNQANMCEVLGFGRANMSRIEQGEVFPSPTTLKILKERFDLSLDWFITGDGPMFFHQIEKEKDEDTQLLEELMYLIKNVSVVRHEVLAYFQVYKIEHYQLIRQQLLQLEAEDSKKDDTDETSSPHQAVG